MQITKHGRFLVQLTRFPRFFPINCYLVREDDGLTLVDTGMSGTAPAILAAAESEGMPIKRIVLTHSHGDHVGSLDALHAALPSAEVLIMAREARLLAGDYTLDPDESQSKLKGSYQKCATVPTRTLSSGDRIGSLEVVASPGHTPAHAAFFDVRDRTLIAGDAYQVAGGLAVSGMMRPGFPWPAMATWDAAMALESARALRDLQPARLAVGHGVVLGDLVHNLDGAIGAAERKLKFAHGH